MVDTLRSKLLDCSSGNYLGALRFADSSDVGELSAVSVELCALLSLAPRGSFRFDNRS